MHIIRLKRVLDGFYRSFDYEGRLVHDPIVFPRRYDSPRDAETAGFIASCLAYGRADLFMKVAGRLLGRMGESPYDFIMDFDLKRHRSVFDGISYRFNETDDIICLVYILHIVLNEYGSLEHLFMKHFDPGDRTIERGLAGFVKELRQTDASPVYGSRHYPSGLLQFFPSPSGGSACKRMNLYLRWMIRGRDIDLGLWKGVSSSALIIPLDTHIARISRCLKLTRRKAQDWKMAEEITGALRKLDPADPVKYDFALCHHGISGICRGIRGDKACSGCLLKNV